MEMRFKREGERKKMGAGKTAGNKNIDGNEKKKKRKLYFILNKSEKELSLKSEKQSIENNSLLVKSEI